MDKNFSGKILDSQAVERIRLILSTYQDGTGMLESGEATIPGWRDFERATAIALRGIAQESKAIYDVKVPLGDGTFFGVSCKMRKELRKVRNQGRASLEISNSSKKFWSALNKNGITVDNYKSVDPATVGKILCELIEKWHEEVSAINGGDIHLSQSFFLSLSWDQKDKKYQLHQFNTALPKPESLSWSFPTNKGQPGKRVSAALDNEVVIEWYGESGGQFKYYPKISEMLWGSAEFSLEPLPDGAYGIINKAAAYFPSKWHAATE
jgi:hypothetical protein